MPPLQTESRSEALNNIAAQTRRMIIVLNDNAWSIDKNVGAIAEYFHKITTNATFNNLHDKAAGLIEKVWWKGSASRRPQGGRGRKGSYRSWHALRRVWPQLLRSD